MRSALVSTLAVSLVIAGMPTMPSKVQAQVIADAALLDQLTPPVIVNMFKEFPNGGEQLSKRITDLVVKHRVLAPEVANYVVKAPNLTRAQRVAAEHGLAAALERLGINAADMNPPAPPPYKAPEPVVEEEGFNPAWLLLAAALIGGGVACALECFHHHAAAAPATPN